MIKLHYKNNSEDGNIETFLFFIKNLKEKES
jgi:hypothetical protein